MESTQLKAILETLIFVADEPISANALGLVLAQDGIETAAVRQVLEELIREYRDDPARGVEIREVAGGYQLRTKPALAAWIQRLNVPKPVRLSQAAMETLAIVAYRQPIVRAEVEEIRGVDCGGVLKTLLERNLIRIVGKRDEPGTPLLYATSQEFLSIFNLDRLEALPTLKEYRELEEQRKFVPTVEEGEEGNQPHSGGEGGIFGKTGSGGARQTEDALINLPVEGASNGFAVARGKTEGFAESMTRAPVITPELQVRLDAEDQLVSKELEEQIRALRHLEHAIFPRPVETLTAIDSLEQAPGDLSSEHSEREGGTQQALPVGGATRAPVIDSELAVDPVDRDLPCD